jgi:hypothetical protein
VTSHARNLKRRYGLTPEQYDALAAAQCHRCAICRDVELLGSHLCVDHCHTTGRIRGLLCRECNSALGKFRDDPRLLNAARDYLLSHANPEKDGAA